MVRLFVASSRAGEDAMRQEDGTGSGAEGAVGFALPAPSATDPLVPAAALSGAVAHDLGNLLTVVLGNAELLVESLAGRPALAELAQLILSAAQRGTDLTARLDRFARRVPAAKEPTDTAALLADFGRRLTLRLPPTVHLEVAIPEGLWPVGLPPAVLALALDELTKNALAALDGQGRLRVLAANHAVAGEAAQVRLVVHDNGRGMDAAMLERCRQPGFMAGVAGHRTALGLALVMRIAAAGGGRLSLDSKPGQGTYAILDLTALTSGCA